jgi:hypothetical protein
MVANRLDGRLPKWPTGADCKSAGLRLRWFESSTYHHLKSFPEPSFPPLFSVSFAILLWITMRSAIERPILPPAFPCRGGAARGKTASRALDYRRSGKSSGKTAGQSARRRRLRRSRRTSRTTWPRRHRSRVGLNQHVGRPGACAWSENPNFAVVVGGLHLGFPGDDEVIEMEFGTSAAAEPELGPDGQ